MRIRLEAEVGVVSGMETWNSSFSRDDDLLPLEHRTFIVRRYDATRCRRDAIVSTGHVWLFFGETEP